MVDLNGLVTERLVEELDRGLECSKIGVGGGGSGRSRMSCGSKRETGSGGGTSCKSRSALFLSIHKCCTGSSYGWTNPGPHVNAGDSVLLPV